MFLISRIRLELELLDDRAPRDFWGSRLRGGFGETLRTRLCEKPEPLKCRSGEEQCICAYAALFEPARATHATHLKGAPLGNQTHLPAAFVIKPPDPGRRSRKGDLIDFELTGFGPMCTRMVQAVKAFEDYGRVGLIRSGGRAHFRIANVCDALAGGRSIYYEGRVNEPSSRMVSEVANANLPANLSSSSETLQVIFTTPVRVKNERAKLSDPGTGLTIFNDFWDLVYNLVNRVGGLWQLYGEDWPGQAEFYRWRNRLLQSARQIETSERKLTMMPLRGYSNRQEAAKRLDGFAGSMTFRGELDPFRQLLAIGELVQVGGETSAGLGCYRLMV